MMARGQEEDRKELCIAEGFSEVGGSRAEGICRWTVHVCAVVTRIVLCWWGGKGSCFFKSETSLCYAVNDNFYYLIIQLPLDV